MMKKLSVEQENSIVERLEELVLLGGPESVHELIETFFHTGRKNLAEMKMAIEKSSYDLFKNAAQNLKSVCLNLGAADFAQICQAAAHDKSFHKKTEAGAMLLRIESQLTITENFLRGFIQDNQSSAG